MTKPVQPPLVHDAQDTSDRPQSEINKATQPPSRPSQRPPSHTTTVRPTATLQPLTGPSNCEWAIVTCCSTSDPALVSQQCFDLRGCPGPFWDSSPCESSFARNAIKQVRKYYSQNPRASVGK